MSSESDRAKKLTAGAATVLGCCPPHLLMKAAGTRPRFWESGASFTRGAGEGIRPGSRAPPPAGRRP